METVTQRNQPFVDDILLLKFLNGSSLKSELQPNSKLLEKNSDIQNNLTQLDLSSWPEK